MTYACMRLSIYLSIYLSLSLSIYIHINSKAARAAHAQHSSRHLLCSCSTAVRIDAASALHCVCICCCKRSSCALSCDTSSSSGLLRACVSASRLPDDGSAGPASCSSGEGSVGSPGRSCMPCLRRASSPAFLAKLRKPQHRNSCRRVMAAARADTRLVGFATQQGASEPLAHLV